MDMQLHIKNVQRSLTFYLCLFSFFFFYFISSPPPPPQSISLIADTHFSFRGGMANFTSKFPFLFHVLPKNVQPKWTIKHADFQLHRLCIPQAGILYLYFKHIRFLEGLHKAYLEVPLRFHRSSFPDNYCSVGLHCPQLCRSKNWWLVGSYLVVQSNEQFEK